MTLLHRFTLVSLTSAVILSVMFGELAARIATEFALRRQAHAFAVYVSEFAAPRLVPADFFQPPPAVRAQFEFTLRSLVGRAHIQHVSVWNRRGEILYSDDPRLVGTVQTLAPPMADALGGQLRWQLLPADGGPRTVGRMEVFVPVVVSGDSRPVGVYHVVADIPDLEPTLVRLSRTVRASVVGGILLLYLATFTVVRQASRDLDRQQRALRAAFIGIVRSLANAVDARDMPTAHHSSRVAEYAEAIAREMGLDEETVGVVQVAGLLHDVGKIGIRDELLSKNGGLTPQEWEVMRRHPVLGYEILEPVPISEEIKLAVRHSHERWDGTGYPDGLAGLRIPIAARIIAVADAYEALVTDRPYRRAQSPLRAVEEIRREAGRGFDPAVVGAFLRVLGRRGVRAPVPLLLPNGGRQGVNLLPPAGDGQRPGEPARRGGRHRLPGGRSLPTRRSGEGP
ncbi:MAG: HD-GYP domain-containing protein [Armatimonadota bacterium]|nr:HD-GYP domain-containing protein [Armatimonadota bacterium]MDR7506110.1 HD-GYP domain-containing protein [Armatimonadota bacterium]MDR7516108.1 HD-GYP domain-containing protein [Armatimonadota bacterium]